ncbi:PorV/PorQ family protein [bacterium]|nr:PorV/PorQ family protein [bacterium]
MRSIKFSLLSILVIMSLPAQALSFWNSPGSDGARILKQSISARAQAAGEAFVAVSNDISALYYNPAGLGYIASAELSGSYIKSFEDTYYSHFGYIQPIASGALAVSYLGYDGGLMEINEEDGSSLTLKAQQDAVFSLGFGWQFDSFPKGVAIGTTLKIISSTLVEEYAAIAYAIDFGLFYPTPVEGLAVAFALQNIGTKLNYFSENDPLPLTARVGTSYKLTLNQYNSLRISLDLVNNKINSGIEYSLNDILLARIGYKLNQDLASLTYGFGLCLGPFKLDYAFGDMSDLGNLHLFSLTIGNANY